MHLAVIQTKYLTMTEAGAKLGRCERTIRSWIRSGHLKGGLLRGRLVVHEDEVNKVLAEQGISIRITPQRKAVAHAAD